MMCLLWCLFLYYWVICIAFICRPIGTCAFSIILVYVHLVYMPISVHLAYVGTYALVCAFGIYWYMFLYYVGTCAFGTYWHILVYVHFVNINTCVFGIYLYIYIYYIVANSKSVNSH